MTNQELYRRLSRRLLNAQNNAGHWVGELSASALSTATSISAFSFYLASEGCDPADREDLVNKIGQGLRWILNRQNPDGGWGDTDKSKSNISTTMLVEAAVAAASAADAATKLMLESFQLPLKRARQYIKEQGGIEGLRARYGVDKTFAVPILANCAMAGLVPWKEVAVLPFEAACVPQRFYHLLQLPVVSYAIPALVAIGQAKYFNDPPWNPLTRTIRKMCVRGSLKVLKRMQPSTGGFLEAAPLTGFVCMGLIKSGNSRHSVVTRGIRFLQESFRVVDTAESSDTELESAVPIDTNLATWVTTLSVNALASETDDFSRDPELWKPTLDWVLSCQNKEVHPFTGAAPGGWGWTDLSGSVPDADDTPGALLALRKFYDLGYDNKTSNRILDAAEAGVEWLLNLQNRDKGWPTFCRGWGKLPFDRSGSDLTAHAIRAFVAWRTKLTNPEDTARLRIQKHSLDRAITRGFEYLARKQRADGSWLPLWFGNQDQNDDENPVYGTVKVLAAYRDDKRLNTQEALDGLDWLMVNQNEDGGWGGGRSLDWSHKSCGWSSVEETGLALELVFSLLSPENQDLLSVTTAERLRASAKAGFTWLETIESKGLVERSSPIGFYFAKLWYYEKLYPLIFATSAAAQAATLNFGESAEAAEPNAELEGLEGSTSLL